MFPKLRQCVEHMGFWCLVIPQRYSSMFINGHHSEIKCDNMINKCVCVCVCVYKLVGYKWRLIDNYS
jgi:hypothetical protein